MRSLPFKKLDAFATAQSAGNPAAALYLDDPDDLSDPQMQRVARELKGFVSEVGFIAPAGPGAFAIRYFSSEKEVEFCGHATVAIMYDLIASNPELRQSQQVRLRTNVGTLPIENRIESEDSVYVHAPLPRFHSTAIGPSEVAEALGIEPHCFDRSTPIGLVNAGLETLCVPFTRLDDVLNLAPDYACLLRFCQRYGVDVIAVFTSAVADSANQLRSRVFAAPFGYVEDPATGSANAALGYHLHRLGSWNGLPIRIEQGPDRLRPNIVRLASATDEDQLRVVFGGGAVVRIEGRYLIQD